MATIPSFEAVLLKIHQGLGLVPYQTRAKENFADLGMQMDNHADMAFEVLDAIFKALHMDDQACFDASGNIMEWTKFQKALELNTWTSNADQRQVLWHLLGYSYVPGLARRIAFWNGEGAFDKGMPGGKFWFLPHVDASSGKLELPVPCVVGWLLDLIGLPMDQAKDGFGGVRHNESADSMERNLYLWQKSNVPRVESINRYFPDDAKLEFKGIFKLADDLAEDARFAAALEFVRNVKGLNAEGLRDQIPMTEPGHLEAILDESAPAEQKQLFVDLLLTRYAKPTMRTVRQRLLVARMIQDGYSRLLKFLCPGVNETCTDPHENKLLQLAGIFGFIYNLTIAAWKNCDTEEQENAWFEAKLPPWDKADIFLSILPSRRETAHLELAATFSRRFAVLSDDAPLEDLVPLDEESARPIIERKVQRLKEEAEENVRLHELIDRLRTGSPWRALQCENNFWVVSQVGHNKTISPKARDAATKRIRELAATPFQTFCAIVMELDTLLNCRGQDRPKDAQQRVEALLKEGQANPDFEKWKAPLLQYEAKHLLALNDFEGAGKLFRQALEACSERNYGKARGEIARDALAIAVADQHLIPGNHEKYYRNMLDYGMFEDKVHSLEDTATWASDYFWDDLYKPYHGVENKKPMAATQAKAFIKETAPLILAADWEGLRDWMKRHAKTFRKNKIREVRGDTVLMIWLKMRKEIRERLMFLKFKMPPHWQNGVAELENFLESWHKAIALLVELWPEQVNLTDFKSQTPMMLVADAGDDVLVHAFLAAGANINAQDYKGRTALHAAVTSRSVSCVVALLNQKPDVTKVTVDGQTVLHTAVRMGHPEIVRLLLAHDASLKSRENSHGHTPLDLAKYFLGDLSEVEALMAKEGRCIGSRDDFAAIILALSDGTMNH